uniref:Ribosomal protein L29 n=1 Tax=Compsothamnion thuioides TaxID=3097386 RepID=A0A4D6WRJ8_9FLOR|nr:ribosomal protein L29 [Compsothamnion thuyoides]
MNEIKNIDDNSIKNQINKLKKQLILIEIKKATRQDIKPHIIKQIKNKISQLLTLSKNN